jgi:chaperonin GroEL (HSP60 family)
MIVDIGLFMGSEFDPNMISVKEILGGNLSDSFFLKGIVIKKPFSYAGYEKQNKNQQKTKQAKLQLLQLVQLYRHS